MNGMNYTPEMINFLRDITPKAKGILAITDLFNKEFNTNLSPRKINRVLFSKNIKYKQIHKGKNIGSEFTSIKGGTYIKFSNGREGSKYDNWKLKHRYLYEQAHNIKIPKNYRVIFLDHNNFNFELDNLELVSPMEFILLRKYGFHFNNKELTKTGLAIIRHRLAALNVMARGMGEEEKTKTLNKYYMGQWKKKKEERNHEKQSI